MNREYISKIKDRMSLLVVNVINFDKLLELSVESELIDRATITEWKTLHYTKREQIEKFFIHLTCGGPETIGKLTRPLVRSNNYDILNILNADYVDSERWEPSTKPPFDQIKSSPVIKFKRVSEYAYEPKRGSKFSAGFDLFSANDYIVPPMDRLLISTGIIVKIPEGCYGRIAPRSGLAYNQFIDVGGGVIDQDYRGSLSVILFNFAKTEFKISRGDRIAQLICEKICYPTMQEVDYLDQTDRGEDGLGSSGMN